MILRISVCCLLAIPSIAHAAQSKLISEDDYLDEVPQVLTVSRLAQPLKDAPAAVTIIDRATIKASGAIDLPEVFRLVPGFYVGTNAGYIQNTNHVVSYHGMTDAYSRRMQVLIDGRSVYEPLYGGVQWSEIPLAISDIERIEITRGPNAASYGANSFLGVINIITLAPSESTGNSISTSNGGGRHETFYKYGGKLEDLTYRVTVGHKEDDGLQNRTDTKRTSMISARADLKATDRDNIEFQFGYADGTRQEGMIELDPYIFLPRDKEINNHFEMIKWRRTLQNNSDLQIQAYHSYDKINDDVLSTNLSIALGVPLADPFIRINNVIESERSDIEIQHTVALLDTLRAVWGGSIRQDKTIAPRYLDTSKTDNFNLQRLFGQVEWHATDKLVFNAGGMVEHNDFTGTDISPRASINFSPIPTQTLRLGVSTALRTPTYLEEKFKSGVSVTTTLPIPNPTLLRQYFYDKGDLAPEKITSREIGYLGTFGNLNVDVRIFSDKIDDIIRQLKNIDFVYPVGTQKYDGRPFTYENAGQADVNGFEVQSQWKIGSSSRLIGNYSHTKIKPSGPLERDYVDSAPDNSISALFMHRFNHEWDGSLAYYQTSATASLGDGNMVNLIRRWDGRLARSFEINSQWHGELSGTVQNLFDNHYQEFSYYNTLGRRAYVNLTLEF